MLAAILTLCGTTVFSRTGRNISKSTFVESLSRGLPIAERASTVSSSSNRFSPIGLRYIVVFSIDSANLYHKGI